MKVIYLDMLHADPSELDVFST